MATNTTRRSLKAPILQIAFPPRRAAFRLFIQELHDWKALEYKMFEKPFGVGEGAVRVTSEGD